MVNTLGDLFDGGSKDQKTPAKDQQPQTNDQQVKRELPKSTEQIQLSFAPLVEKTAPAVVNVYATRMIRPQTPFDNDPFFQQFFGRLQGRARKESALGSGVIVDKSGLVVTNYHVIKDADEIKVALDDGREFECSVVLKDQKVDLAVLKIKSNETFPTLTIGNSDKVKVGDLVLAIGDPFGVGQTVTSGIVSGLARTRINDNKDDFGFFIQTDAAINPGNSGGALVGLNGELIGINSEIYTRSGGSDGIGFAIPANLVRTFVKAAETGEKHFEMPYVGARFESITPDIAEALGLERSRGALVNSVVPKGPAAKAGLKVGDVVTALDGMPVEHPDALGYRLAAAGIGQTAKLTVVNQNKTRTVEIKLEPAPETVPADTQEIGGNTPFTGATVANLSPRIAQNLDMPTNKTGVVVTDIADGSIAARFGLQPKDIIVAVNGYAIKSVDDLESAVHGDRGSWRFEINRNGQILRQFVQ
ncbi:MAG TPA: DegQ family serine endoprotease [Pararhizobium sp.]|nr:DegQ family serine endoprotease [Pararhizobium sp.]